MRVLLVGRRGDRDRLRPALLAAGIVIVSEAAAQPAETPDDVDAVVVAPPAEREAFQRFQGLPAEAHRAKVGSKVRGFESGTAAEERRHARDDVDATAEPLTAREREVLALVAEGLPNKAIAASLGISDQTVKFHVAAIIGKLGAANRTDAVRRAVRQGLVVI